MRIFVDARCVRPGATGVGLAAEAMLRALTEAYPEDQIFALALPRSPLESLCRPNLHLLSTRIDYEWHPLAELYSHLILPRIATRLRADVYWGPAFAIPTRKSLFPRVVSVHDLSVFDYPSEYPRAFGAYLRWQIVRSIRAADAVVCVSHFTRDRIASRWPSNASKCEVIPCGVDDFFFTETMFTEPAPPLPRKFILTVGAGQPRKNAQFGAEVVRILREEFRLPYDYVVVGKDPTLPSWVHQYASRPKRDLVAFYRQAALLLMPSTDEGFGIPALEAMAAGCPVAVSNRGALPEVVGNAAAYVFALEDGPSKIADCLAEILRDENFLTAKRELGKQRAREFLWENAARKLRGLFQKLCEKNGATSG